MRRLLAWLLASAMQKPGWRDLHHRTEGHEDGPAQCEQLSFQRQILQFPTNFHGSCAPISAAFEQSLTPRFSASRCRTAAPPRITETRGMDSCSVRSSKSAATTPPAGKQQWQWRFEKHLATPLRFDMFFTCFFANFLCRSCRAEQNPSHPHHREWPDELAPIRKANLSRTWRFGNRKPEQIRWKSTNEMSPNMNHPQKTMDKTMLDQLHRSEFLNTTLGGASNLLKA